MDCCPTVTEVTQRAIAINPQGLLLELFHTPNFTQTFYETVCHPAIKGRPCQFLDRKYISYSKCVQQYSYVYALGRTYGNWYEQFRIDYVRVATGCKCQLTEDLVSDYSLKSRYLNEI
ncbi:hypothetical protein LSH36_147g08004 [Paralvinella palmiformis]|uniref:Nerve growth factor-related domain-containing protein n=1 Tax=Paralvinella palmiformis TaxID=53620 RepID=A0AAD9JUV8_9ANNE|nr:hypothetical protein LSH36_147g08004 [Paralvinella palmiformis]